MRKAKRSEAPSTPRRTTVILTHSAEGPHLLFLPHCYISPTFGIYPQSQLFPVQVLRAVTACPACRGPQQAGSGGCASSQTRNSWDLNRKKNFVLGVGFPDIKQFYSSFKFGGRGKQTENLCSRSNWFKLASFLGKEINVLSLSLKPVTVILSFNYL